MQTHNLTIIVSLFSLGFFGGFSHCAGMCGPFVLTQVSNRLQSIELQNYTTLKRLQNMALLPYHLGRITTYSVIGFICAFITSNIKDFANFNLVSGILLLIAALIFWNNLFEKKHFSLPFHLPKFKSLAILEKLFRDPRGFRGYLLGLILGFIPCGLLYGAFALCASIDKPALAALGMFLFGIATIPALFLTAAGGYIFLKISNSNFKFISKIVLIINIITLVVMAVGLILK